MAVIDSGSSSAGKANVNATYDLQVALPTAATPSRVGGVRLFSENDDGTHTGSAYLKSPETSSDFRLRVGVDTLLHNDIFNTANTQNVNVWAHTFATMTVTEPSLGYVQFGTVQGTTSAHGAFLRTWQSFPLINTSPIACEFYAGQFTAQMVANEILVMGVGLPPAAANSISTDGVFFRLTSGAGLEGVIRFNNAEVATDFDVAKPLTDFATGSVYKFLIVIGENEVEYWIDDVLMGEQAIPVTQGVPWLSGAGHLVMQKYNSGNVANTNVIRVFRTGVTLMDSMSGRPWAVLQAAQGLMAYQGQNGSAYTNTALLPNATGATTVTGAALAQATALASGIGGQAGITATTPGVDGWVTAYLNPVATTLITGRNLIITGIHISSVNIGAAVATTPSTLQWSIAFGGTQLNSLATGDGAAWSTLTAKAARRIAVGLQSWIVGAALGAQAQELDQDFSDAPIVVHPGQYLGSVAKFIQGTATASQVIWSVVTFRGYWE